MSALGRLERVVDLRRIWPGEASHFTPWLAQEGNLSLLGDTLGLELELEAQERSVGPFRADILCKNTADGSWVLVENQLERTDHTHLGQLITYAAGLQAVTIVWIATRFADEHREACDWLNKMTDERIRIFALEVELWRIGNSPAAPKFNIVSKPNDWSKHVSAAKKGIEEGDLSPTRELQYRYWEALEEKLRERNGPVNAVSAQAQSWIGHGIGKTGVALNFAMVTRDNLVRVEIYFSGPHAKPDYAAIAEHRANLESELGCQLNWQPLPEKKDCRISLALTGADPSDEADWPRQHAWLVEKAEKFYRAFRAHILALRRDSQPDNGEAG